MTPQTGEDQRRKLTVEIFEMTGLKVDVDDPVTVVALFLSQTMRKATQEAASVMAQVGKVEQERLKETAAVELRRSQDKLALFAAQAKRDFFKEVSYGHEGEKNHTRLVVGCIAGMVGVAILALAVGAAAFGKRPLSPVEQKEIEVGRIMIQAFPLLDAQTKLKVLDAAKSANNTPKS